MKVMQIMPEFGLAGAEIMCENLTYELIKLDYEVIVISLYDYHSAITERLEKKGVDVRYLGKRSGLDFSVIRKLITVFESEKPDVIHTHRYIMRYVIPAAIKAGVPGRIHTVHNIASKECGKIDRILNKFFYKFCNVKPVALSSIIQETIVQEYKLSKNEIPIVLNGINIENCKPKSSYQISEKCKILHIGRFSEQKNHLMLVKSFEKLHKKRKDVCLVLIGNGEKRKEIESYVKEHKLTNSVSFVGLKSNVFIDLYNADVFVLPSNYEGIPMTLIEAMGTALPIIATSVGGVPDMIQNNESGLLIQNNQEELVSALERLIDDENKRAYLGQNALIRSKKFSSQVMAEKYSRIYISSITSSKE